MDAAQATTNRVIELAWELACAKGRTCLEVMRAVLSTKTLARLGYSGTGHLTQRQADAAVAILELWNNKTP